MTDNRDHVPPTSEKGYADRLVDLQTARWKRLIPVQLPYGWNLRRLDLGRTLEIGCGIGRNLEHLKGNGVGVDHNADAVTVARSRGFEAYTPEEFLHSGATRHETFDSLLLAHVVEHMNRTESVELIRSNLTYVRPGGKVVMITPQERGFRSDATHIEFVDFDALSEIAAACGLTTTRQFSFPFGRFMGSVFPYNEFVSVAERP